MAVFLKAVYISLALDWYILAMTFYNWFEGIVCNFIGLRVFLISELLQIVSFLLQFLIELCPWWDRNGCGCENRGQPSQTGGHSSAISWSSPAHVEWKPTDSNQTNFFAECFCVAPFVSTIDSNCVGQGIRERLRPGIPLQNPVFHFAFVGWLQLRHMRSPAPPFESWSQSWVVPATYFYPRPPLSQPLRSIGFWETRMISLAPPFARGPPPTISISILTAWWGMRQFYNKGAYFVAWWKLIAQIPIFK